jgi:hypothetical protein
MKSRSTGRLVVQVKQGRDVPAVRRASLPDLIIRRFGGGQGMGKRCLLATVSVFLSLPPGCSGPSGPTPAAAAPSWAKGTVDGVSCEVRGDADGGSSSFVSEGYREFTAGRNKLRVQDGRITANGKEYGSVKSGDTVLLDVDGTVTVNGAKRQVTRAGSSTEL